MKLKIEKTVEIDNIRVFQNGIIIFEGECRIVKKEGATYFMHHLEDVILMVDISRNITIGFLSK